MRNARVRGRFICVVQQLIGTCVTMRRRSFCVYAIHVVSHTLLALRLLPACGVSIIQSCCIVGLATLAGAVMNQKGLLQTQLRRGRGMLEIVVVALSHPSKVPCVVVTEWAGLDMPSVLARLCL